VEQCKRHSCAPGLGAKARQSAEKKEAMQGKVFSFQFSVFFWQTAHPNQTASSLRGSIK